MEHRPVQPERNGLIGLRSTLRTLDLSEPIIQRIIKKATFELTQEDIEDADLIYDFALREISEMVNVDMPLFSKTNPFIVLSVSLLCFSSEMANGACTKSTVLVPLSSLFNSLTACPVVPDPAKKSRIAAFLFLCKDKILLISVTGFGWLNGVALSNNAFMSAVPSSVVPNLSISFVFNDLSTPFSTSHFK